MEKWRFKSTKERWEITEYERNALWSKVYTYYLTKMEENEISIPIEWRPILSEIVLAFVHRDFQHVGKIYGVRPIDGETATQIQDYIEDYGETLIELPDETWESSVAQYQGDGRWEFLVDLWTKESGLSDLVLEGTVEGMGKEFSFEVHLVYVP